METALVVAIIAATVLYLARRFFITRKNEPSRGCEGCSGCGHSQALKDAQPCAGPHKDPDDEILP